MGSRAILAIDTAGPRIGAGVASESHPDLFWEARVVRGADSLLLPAIASLLADLDARGDTLVGVAVVVGPGAFTGLRVGLAAALGVAVARGVPVFPEGTLEARARLESDRPLVVLMDARKNRFYAQTFDVEANGAAVDQTLHELLSVWPKGALFLGEGALVSREPLEQAGFRVASDVGRLPVLHLARAALDGQLVPVDAAAVRLQYVRPPDAKRPVHLLSPPMETS